MTPRLLFPLVTFLALAACNDDKKETVDPASLDAGPKGPVVGGKLGEALASAESQTPVAPAKDPNGPPESGVFAPGAADKAMAKGAPPKIEVINEGAEPRTTLALKIPGDAEERTSVTLATRSQNQQVPPLTFALSMKADKKDKDAKDPGTRVVAKVTDVSLGKDVSAPKDAVQLLGKLKGSEIRFTLAPNGTPGDVSATLSKDADPALDQQLGVVAETLMMMTPPLPSKPVGVGAYWMVTDRIGNFGFDCVRYRVFKVTKIEDGAVTLDIDTRMYVASGDFDAGRGQKLQIEQFDAQGKGDVLWTPATFVPPAGEVQHGIKAQLATGQAGQKAVFQAQVNGRIEPADKPDKKPEKKPQK